MNYNLTKIPPPSDHFAELDVFGQLARLDTSWRSNLMKDAMCRAELIPGLKDRRIFNFTERENRRKTDDSTENENWSTGSWKSKARNKPLIGDDCYRIKLDRPQGDNALFDWGAKNFIAAIIDFPVNSAIVIIDAQLKNTGTVAESGKHVIEMDTGGNAIKWNHAGDKFGVVTNTSELKIFNLNKLEWNRKCCCNYKFKRHCNVNGLAWSNSDKEIVIYCNEGRISSFTTSGILIHSILSMVTPDFISEGITFSPNDRYIAMKSFWFISIFTWPDLQVFLEIAPMPPPESFMKLSWHPWHTNILGIGSWPDTNSISVWDIHNRELLGCKKASCLRCVDEISWNKLSGELIVLWENYTEDEIPQTLITVHSNLEQIVDAVPKKNLFYGLIWNPDHTLLAMREDKEITILKFFGDETEKWQEIDSKKKNEKKNYNSLKRKRIFDNDYDSYLDYFTIR